MIELMTGIYLTILSGWDLKKKSVPAVAVFAGLLACTGWCFYRCVLGVIPPGTVLIGMLPGVGMLLVARFSQAAGYGDGLVLVGLGMLWGIWRVLLLLAGSLFALSLVSLLLLLLGKVRGNTRIPFLPFLDLILGLQIGSVLLEKIGG